MAARAMGYRIQVLDPDPACPARFVVDGCIEAGWDDSREAANLARGCDVVTLEIEQISPASMNAAASFAPVRPGGEMLAIIQDRIEQKDWPATHRLSHRRLPCRCGSLDQLRDAIVQLGGKVLSARARPVATTARGQGKVGFNPDAARFEDELSNAHGLLWANRQGR